VNVLQVYQKKNIIRNCWKISEMETVSAVLVLELQPYIYVVL